MVINGSKRNLLAEHVKKLAADGQLGLPLGADYSAHPDSIKWTDRITGTEYFRVFPSLLADPELGLAVQTKYLLDSIVCNLGVAGGSKFAVTFTQMMVDSGYGRWQVKSTYNKEDNTENFAEWICRNEQYGALEHGIFSKETIAGIADAIKSGAPVQSVWRSPGMLVRRLWWSARNREYGGSTYDAEANWSVPDTPCRELLSQLNGLKRNIFKLAQDACKHLESANHWAQHRFQHPIYWLPELKVEGNALCKITVVDVLSYAAEALAVNAALLSLYAVSIKGSKDEKVQFREGIILGEALNNLARAYALRYCAKRRLDTETKLTFDVIGSDDFESGYIEAYQGFAEKLLSLISPEREFAKFT